MALASRQRADRQVSAHGRSTANDSSDIDYEVIMANADALEAGELITKFCVDCRHFIPSHRHNPEPKCKKFRFDPEPTYGHSKPRKCSVLRKFGCGDVLCGPRGKGWEAKPDSWYKTVWEVIKCMDVWNWPPPGGGPDPLRDDDPGGIR